MARPVLTDEQWEKVDRIDGWLTREEADLLYGLCDGPWLEIGAWKGKSTTVLAETGHPGTVIDWFRGSPEHDRDTWTLPEYAENMRDYPHVRTCVLTAEECGGIYPDGRSLIHFDGDHSYEATAEAFDLYEFLLDEGGVAVFHDYRDGASDPWPGVTKFVDELIESGEWEKVAQAGRSIALRAA